MRILPLSIQLIHKKNLNSNRVSIPVVNVNNTLQKDTVSFSGNFLQDAYDNLESTINNQIMPFVNENKGTYQALIDINNDANSVISKFSEQEMTFISRKVDLQDLSQVEKSEFFTPMISRYDAYKRNLSRFNNLKNTLKGDCYSSIDIQNTLKNTQNLLFNNNPEVEKIKPLARKYKEVSANIEKYNNEKTLNASDLPLKEKLHKVNESRYQAAAYALLMPMPEIFMMLRTFKEAGKEVQHPTQSLMKTLTSVEHLQQSADSIIKDIDRYGQYSNSVNKFIEDYNNDKPSNPSKNDIEAAYDSLIKDCEKNAANEYVKLMDFYNEEYKEKGVTVDFKSFDDYLNKCKNAVDALYNKKKAVDQKIIEENNRKFFEQMGIDSSEAKDD